VAIGPLGQRADAHLLTVRGLMKIRQAHFCWFGVPAALLTTYSCELVKYGWIVLAEGVIERVIDQLG